MVASKSALVAPSLTAMARNKKLRYRSAGDLAGEIRAYLAGTPLQKTPTGLKRWVMKQIYR